MASQGTYNKGPAPIEALQQDGLNGDFALLDQLPASSEIVSWGHLLGQAPGISNREDDLGSRLSPKQVAEVLRQQGAEGAAWPELQPGSPNLYFHNATLDPSAAMLYKENRNPQISPTSFPPKPVDASPSTMQFEPIAVPTPYVEQASIVPETSARYDQSGPATGQQSCWSLLDESIGDSNSAEPGLGLNLSSFLDLGDDNGGQLFSYDSSLHPGFNSSDDGMPMTHQSHPWDPETRMRAFGNVTIPNGIACEYQTQPLPTVNDDASVQSCQPSVVSPSRPASGTTMSPARARYHGPLSRDDHQPKRRRPFQDLQKRIETGEMRRVGACVRCRLQRLRVSQELMMNSEASYLSTAHALLI